MAGIQFEAQGHLSDPNIRRLDKSKGELARETSEGASEIGDLVAGKNVIDTQGDKGPDEALLAFAIRELIGEDRGSIYTEVDEAPPPETDGIIPAGVVI
ncbi:hypothetical protein A3H38_01445 [candidate division WOR-1 bacterium RIFCSPLOWO2_02_FULL_46_20]|uniref:Uncharacterized protein n=2 Tax=Saganbacteria TaxID=1703751 RepID=A0A1F4RE84_UNCSA|nr:MAG: hypothetical protein A3H38_01445 [candidate division WOR-1 bacterium RIFCSPLOWO2_02_FULL_46_20]OGC09293.1 MAG: hypothetical protein A3F86_00345 [candidate division WOR-1 bacterium RIFCSPLOWO2_12_FULL_45_9]